MIRFLASAHRRRAACLAALDKDGALALPNFAENLFTDLAQFEGRLRIKQKGQAGNGEMRPGDEY